MYTHPCSFSRFGAHSYQIALEVIKRAWSHDLHLNAFCMEVFCRNPAVSRIVSKTAHHNDRSAVFKVQHLARAGNAGSMHKFRNTYTHILQVKFNFFDVFDIKHWLHDKNSSLGTI